MRTIKYRAYLKEEVRLTEIGNYGITLKEMMYNVTGLHFFEGFELTSISIDTEEHGEIQDILLENTFFKLMQFTGFCDRNGKEIYEDDITIERQIEKDVVRNVAISVIKFVPKLAVFLPVPLYILKIDPSLEDLDMWDECVNDLCFGNDIPEQYLEVIGNIYENPELL